MIKLFKNIILGYRLWRLKRAYKNEIKRAKVVPLPYPEYTKKINSTTDIGMSSVLIEVDKIGGVEKSEAWFTRENNLVMEFVGLPPIVYEPDMITIKKEHQYGYIPLPDEIIIKPDGDDRLIDDVDFVKLKDIPSANIAISKNADYLTEMQKFEERWNKIKEVVRTENSGFDGIIKE